MKRTISADFPFESKYVSVRGSRIHYVDEGTGDPILFLHGNPTSSYLWRNIIPYLTDSARCIALDHIGMGKSDKPDIDYGFRDTYDYLNAFIAELGLKNITLVLHDWGSIMGFHYANTNRNNIKAIAFMESSIQVPNFAGMPANVRLSIKMVRNPLLGTLMVKHANIFIKKMLPDLIQRELTEEEKRYYAAPYPNAKSRKPLLTWPGDVPINGKPQAVDKIIKDYHVWLKESDIPKLCLYVTPGIALQKEDVTIVKNEFKNTKLVYLGEGLHFIQEDYPHEIGQNLAEWHMKIKEAADDAEVAFEQQGISR
ncbi:MAG: haloalkane dehalogenase [Chloroflexi bacterium]|nr:haloalkane dehalogenase [Chloroflexota bacterium]